MTWDQIDFERGIWTKPSSHTKQKREHRIALSGPALALLAEVWGKQQGARENDDLAPQFVFPGRRNGHMEDIKALWPSIREEIDIDLWKGHPQGKEVVAGLRQELGRHPSYREITRRAREQEITLPEGFLHEVRPHDLRHSFASILASGGGSLALVGQMLGHTQVQTTVRYAHLFQDAQREAADKVGNAILAPKEGSAEIVELRPGGKP